MTNKYPDAPDCPFCGSRDLSDTDWCDDDGEFDAIECDDCKGSAPADVWCENTRPKAEAEELLEWFEEKGTYMLIWWPEDEGGEWRVKEAWSADNWLTVIGSGPTPLDALRAAREANER